MLLLTVAEAVEFFTEPAVKQTLQTIVRLGLDYIMLGQSLSSFSGGERQRLKLASELDEEGRLLFLMNLLPVCILRYPQDHESVQRAGGERKYGDCD